ncbi:MAG: tRNA epoxyqueuosine(34) reductase QueG [Phycisphaerae bacterium]
MTAPEKAARVRRLAKQAGFDRVGIAQAGPITRADYLRAWLDRGWAGRMDYLHRHFDRRTDPGVLLPGARSVIVVALNYHQQAPNRPEHPPTGQIAMYAWGDDYHRVVKNRLLEMIDALRTQIDEPFQAKACVDTAPILEREWAAASGVGWIGKNTLALHQDLGSYFFLGEIVTTLELPPDPPATDHCGSCTRCLDACPTQAFPAPYRMDASRCISYLTIELRDAIPAEFHGPMGDWVFGCDVCQQVCPHNHRAPLSTAFTPRPPSPYPVLEEVLQWTPQDYSANLSHSPIKRAKLPMLKRNATIAQSNAIKAHSASDG